MGTSQSRTGSEGNKSIDRLKRYSRADLKSPLKAAFGRHKGGAGDNGNSDGTTTTSDYETPIYEAKVCLLLYLSGCVSGESFSLSNLCNSLFFLLATAPTTTTTFTPDNAHACYSSVSGNSFFR